MKSAGNFKPTETSKPAKAADSPCSKMYLISSLTSWPLSISSYNHFSIAIKAHSTVSPRNERSRCQPYTLQSPNQQTDLLLKSNSNPYSRHSSSVAFLPKPSSNQREVA